MRLAHGLIQEAEYALDGRHFCFRVLALAPGDCTAPHCFAVMLRTLGLCLSVHLPTTNARRAIFRLIGDMVRELCTSGDWQGTRLFPGPKA